MINRKTFENARICPKGDIEANWNKAIGFIPLDKEIIIYKKDETHSTARFKVGDGKTGINDLPFSGTDMEAIQQLINEKGELLVEYVDNAVTAIEEKIDTIPQADWNQNDETAKDYIKNKPTAILEGLATEKYVDEKVASIEIPEITVDQTYNSESENAQSGKAVEEAIQPIIEINNDQDSKIADLEGRITTVTFSITKDNTEIEFHNGLPGMTKIDWGDGNVNNELTHNYKYDQNKAINGVCKYNCRIYNLTKIHFNDFGPPDTWMKGVQNISALQIGKSVTAVQGLYYTQISELKIPDSITSIGNSAFLGCSSLTSVEIGDSVTSIGSHAFYNCYNLTSVVIPDSVTSIGDYAFEGCDSLTSVEIGDSVTSIGNYAFSNCDSLMSIVIPDSVISIGYSTFNSCSSLTSVEIGDNVTMIGAVAFSGCNSLTIASFKGIKPISYNSIFYNCPVLTSIRVPKGCLEAYNTKWAADGALEDILNLLVESDENREAYYNDLDSKYDKSGGVISGNVSIQGNLEVTGTTTTKDTETIMVKDNTIVTNSDGIELLEEAGFVIRTDTTNAYGIMYDPVGDGVKIGLGGFDENNKFNYQENQAQFLATRSDTIADRHTVVWDDNTKQLIDSGVGHSEYVKFTDYATADKAGVIKAKATKGFTVDENGDLAIYQASAYDLQQKKNLYNPVTSFILDEAVKISITTNTKTLTDEEKTSTCNWLGAVKKVAYDKTTQPIIGSDGTYTGLLYGVGFDGNETVFPITPQLKNWTLPVRNGNNNFYVGTPKLAYECTNKEYVDNLPDKLTLTENSTDENGEIVQGTREKWRDWLGAVSFTDYMSTDKAGVAMVNPSNSGLQVSNGELRLYPCSPVALSLRNQTGINYGNRAPITMGNLNIAVIATLTDDNKILLTDEEKATACETIGAFKDVTIEEERDNILAWSSAKGWHTTRVDAGNGLALLANGNLVVSSASDAQITSRVSKPLSANKIDLAVTEVLTNYQGTAWTEEQKVSACETIGALKAFDGSKETDDLRYTVYAQQLGEQVSKPYSSTPKEGALAMFASGSSLKTNLVRASNDCTNKDYVDNLPDKLTLTDEQKAKWRDWLDAVGQAEVVADTYTADTIVRRTATGTIHTNTPQWGNEAANKGYVDNLPNNLTLDNEQKFKWRKMIGAMEDNYKPYKYIIYISALKEDNGERVWSDIKFEFLSDNEHTIENYEQLCEALDIEGYSDNTSFLTILSSTRGNLSPEDEMLVIAAFLPYETKLYTVLYEQYDEDDVITLSMPDTAMLKVIRVNNMG